MPTAAGRAIRDQRGVAMIMTLMILLILAALTLAFAMLGGSEPQIAANLERSAEAMGLAEAGIERVIWALNSGALGYPLPLGSIPDPYNGTTDIALGTGVYRVTVAGGATNKEAVVTSEGRVPTWAGYRARRIVKATVTGLPYLNPPCTLCVKGTLTIGNKTVIDARTSTCGTKQGSYSTGLTNILGVENMVEYGLFSNDALPLVPNQPTTDYSDLVAASSFDSFTFTQDQLNLLKDLAKANGTYYGPGYPPPGSPTYTGSVTFANSVPSGIIFVDTKNGAPIDPAKPLDFGSLTIDGDVGAGKGWIVVMGDLSVKGEWLYSGLLYAANKLTKYHAEGLDTDDSSLSGAIIIQNVSASLDAGNFSTSLSKKTNIKYNCDNIRTGGGKYPAFFVKPGSWRELSG